MDLPEVLPPPTPAHLEDRLHLQQLQAEWDAKRFRSRRVLYQRPASVSIICVGLAVCAVFALGAAPFIAAQERIYGVIPIIRSSLFLPVLLFGLMTLPLATLAAKARNWARWGLLLTGICSVILNSFPELDLCLSGLSLGFAISAGLLFTPTANEFFR